MTETPFCSRESTLPVPPSPTTLRHLFFTSFQPFHLSRNITANLGQTFSETHFFPSGFFFFNYTFNKMIHSIATEHILRCQTLFQVLGHSSDQNRNPIPVIIFILQWGKSDNKQDKPLNCTNYKVTSTVGKNESKEVGREKQKGYNFRQNREGLTEKLQNEL